MGMYDTYGEEAIQLKVGPRKMNHYSIGDLVDLADGIYLAHEGAVVINDKRVIFTTKKVFTKWGGEITLRECLEAENPIAKAFADIVKGGKDGEIKEI